VPARIASGLDVSALDEAAALLRAGELVAFPTETVYGLGADATSAAAVAKIYEAKGRPAHNPIIVHVLDAAEAKRWTEGWSDRAEALAYAFWPGPLTMVLVRKAEIPAIVSAGQSTLAVRAPAHPIARELLGRFGGPIAAPSANRSNEVSPTRAEHVARDLGDRVALIVDGGPCEVGLESTVVDLTSDPPRVLRPGSITASEIAEVLGRSVEGTTESSGPLRSPGQLRRHYAPRRPLRLGSREELEARTPQGFSRSAVLTVGTSWSPAARGIRHLPSDPEGYGREIYEAIRWADDQDVEAICVERPPNGEAWRAVHDRLNRAAATDDT
jgi:L-threonylcarbamoyladenylate synthase